MAKIFKVTGYFVDPNDSYDSDNLRVELEQNYDLISHQFKVEECNIGEWDDEILLNKIDCPVSECEKYFVKKGHKTAYETITTMPIDELAEFLVDCIPFLDKMDIKKRQQRIQSMKQVLLTECVEE